MQDIENLLTPCRTVCTNRASITFDQIKLIAFEALNDALSRSGLNSLENSRAMNPEKLRFQTLFAWKIGAPKFSLPTTKIELRTEILRRIGIRVNPINLLKKSEEPNGDSLLELIYDTVRFLTNEPDARNFISTRGTINGLIPCGQDLRFPSSPKKVLEAIEESILICNGGKKPREQVRYGPLWYTSSILNGGSLSESKLPYNLIPRVLQIMATSILNPNGDIPIHSKVILPDLTGERLGDIYNSIYPWINHGDPVALAQDSQNSISHPNRSIRERLIYEFRVPDSEVVLTSSFPSWSLEKTPLPEPCNLVDGFNQNSQLFVLFEDAIRSDSIFRTVGALNIYCGGAVATLPIKSKTTVTDLINRLFKDIRLEEKDGHYGLHYFESRHRFDWDDISEGATLALALTELLAKPVAMNFRGNIMFIKPGMTYDDIITADITRVVLNRWLAE